LSVTLVLGVWRVPVSAAQETPAVWGIVPGDTGAPHAGAALDQVVPKAAPEELDPSGGVDAEPRVGRMTIS